jgi:uncharacterized membrane protein
LSSIYYVDYVGVYIFLLAEFAANQQQQQQQFQLQQQQMQQQQAYQQQMQKNFDFNKIW